jgi:polysaccharide biosynthesis protein PslG
MNPLMLRLMRQTHFLIVILTLLGLAACGPQETVFIYITPTAQPTITQENTPVPTVEIGVLPSATAVVEAQPTVIPPTAVPTLEQTVVIPTPPVSTPVPGSASPTSPAVVVPTQATGSGPIIDANYTLPPSSTSRPTSTSTPINTPVATRLPQYPTLDGNRMGVQLDYNMSIDAYYIFLQNAKWLNVGWIKLQADWSFLQYEGPDAYGGNFQFFVDYVQRTKNEGFKVMLSIAKAPTWARSVQSADAGPPDDPQAYARFITQLIEHIKPENIAAIELWNEPNLSREWTGRLSFDGAGYMQLFRAGYDAVKAAGPNIQIITAGLAPTGSLVGTVDDRVFLQQMYDAGLAQYTDVAVGFHPYSWGNPPDFVCCNNIEGQGWDDDPHFFFSNNLTEYRALMQQNGHNVPMWATEFGWATWEGYPNEPPDEWMKYNSSADQTDYTVRAFEIGQSLDYMGPMMLWNLNFGTKGLIEKRVELAAYSLMYDVDGLSLTHRSLYDVLTNITKRQ